MQHVTKEMSTVINQPHSTINSCATNWRTESGKFDAFTIFFDRK